MEKNSRLLIFILIAALALGALVLAAAPAYRQTLAALARGRAADAPIWRTNRDFYPDVRPFAGEEARGDAE